MSLRLRLAELWLPSPVRRKYFRELMERTARAFEVPPPDLAGLASEEARSRFALFSQACAAGLQADEAARVGAEQRLRTEAIALGRRLGAVLGVRTRSEVVRAARLLYRSIRIDFEATVAGEVRMAACSFADVYSPATCRMIAALDEGLLIGLAGGGTLSFSARLTEGAAVCRARFDFPETLR